MSVSLHDLQAFIEVVKVGSISGAAVNLGVKQPSLSATMRRVERASGTELLIRTKRGVTLTRAGRLFFGRAREMVGSWDAILGELRDEEDTVRGTYTIGVYPALAAYTLPRFLPGLLKQWPELEIEFVHGFSKDITRGVVDLKYDFGIVVNPERHPDLTIRPLYEDQARLWKHPDADWDLRDRRVPLIYHPTGPQIAGIMAELHRTQLLPDCRFIQSTDLSVIAHLTMAGCGIGILPRTVAENEGRGQLQAIPNSPTSPGAIHALVWRGDAQRGHGAAVLRDAICNALIDINAGA